MAEPWCSHWRGHPFYKLVCSDPQFHSLLIFPPSIPTGTITSVALTVSFPSRSGFDFFRKAVKRIILCLQIQIFMLVWIYSPCLGQGQLDLFNVQLCLFFFFFLIYIRYLSISFLCCHISREEIFLLPHAQFNQRAENRCLGIPMLFIFPY